MPIYEFECVDHGIFELLLPISYADSDMSGCSVVGCRRIARRIISLVSMHPDTMWSGVKNEQGYFTSKSKHLSYLKQNDLERVDRSIVEEVKKKSKNKVKETTEKNAIKTERWLAEELKSA